MIEAGIAHYYLCLLFSTKNYIMRIFLSSFFFILSVSCFGQIRIQGIVKDSGNKEPLAFCNIAVKSTGKGTITNADGIFILNINNENDIIVFSYLGYEVYELPANLILESGIILLKKKDYALDEIIICDDDYLFDILSKCRKKLKKDRSENVSRTYYCVETKTSDQPLELLECFYNVYMTGITIEEMMFKNGRTGLAAVDNFFLSRNTSDAISMIDIIENKGFFPLLPLQVGKNEMKKKFKLELLNTDYKMFNVKFMPLNDEQECFSGEVWIEKESLNILKINYYKENTGKHPFLPLFSCDSLYNVSLNITNTYKVNDGKLLNDHINFSYYFTYKSHRDSTLVLYQKDLIRDISSTALLYFYDYEDPFILPYFEYNNNFDDYRKMSLIPYNDVFWNNSNIMILTENQKKDLGFFANEGHLVNYRSGNFGGEFLKIVPMIDEEVSFFEYYYSFWSPDKRIRLRKDILPYSNVSMDKYNAELLFSMYNLEVQILLDATEIEDSIFCTSYTVFDPIKTYYYFTEDEYTNTFINIYFDICEIERIEMQKRLDKRICTIDEVNSIYYETLEKINRTTNLYMKEVQLGKNEKGLTKWNNYILSNLNINNVEMFRMEN